MKGLVRHALVLVAAYLLFLVVQLPAAQLYAWLKPTGVFPLELYQLSGSAWRGRAGTAILHDVRLAPLTWSLQPLALLRGRIELALAADTDGGRFETVVGRRLDGPLFARDVHAEFSLAELARVTGYPGVGLAGRLSVDLDRLRIDGKRLTAVTGTLSIADAGLGSPLEVTLGDFTMTLETAGDGIKGTLKDQGGPLQAEGLLMLQPDGRYTLTAVLIARDPQDGALRQALRFIGTPSPAGRISLKRSGRLPLESYLP